MQTFGSTDCRQFYTECVLVISGANGVTAQEKQIIIDHHNKMRQSVALGQIWGQPPASNMMEMVRT